SLRTFQRLEKFLPVKAEQVVGLSIDTISNDSVHQRSIIANPRNLPHRSQTTLGTETLELLVSPLFDQRNNYMRPMVTWEVVPEKLALDRQLKDNADRERHEAAELSAKVDAMLAVVKAAAAGDLTQEISVRGADAIGQMGQGLDQFLADLRTSIARIAQ